MAHSSHPSGAMPENWWCYAGVYDSFAKVFSHHLLALYVAIRDRGEIKDGVFTGFLVDWQGVLLWMTAGHVVELLNTYLAERRSAIARMCWLDNYEVSHAENVIVHDRNPIRHISKNGDFGAIHIGGLDAANIRSNPKVQPLTPEVWKNPRNSVPEGFFIAGYPGEWTKSDHFVQSAGGTRYTLSACISYLPVCRVPYYGCANKFFRDSDPDAFYGRILPFADDATAQPKSIVGMSGGPIFSLERDPDGRIRYRLIAIQSRWYAPERLIKAEPIYRALSDVGKPRAS